MKNKQIETIVFATHNQHKAEEINQMLTGYEVKSLREIDFHEEIEETGNSFQENAEIKAKTVYEALEDKNIMVFADDSGLVIPVLNGEPGIYSARYAGTGDSKDNIRKVLKELENKEDRAAYFIAVVCLIYNNQTYFFEGKVHGTILNEEDGMNGFGYDPIFKPNGYDKSFASFTKEEKNNISHRFIAVRKMKEFLNQKSF